MTSLAAARRSPRRPPPGCRGPGTLVPGRSLGGIRLGETPHAVRAALGRRFGVCNDCARPTWYFTYKPFDQHGLAVEFTGGRVSAVYTLWQPTAGTRRTASGSARRRCRCTTRAGPLRTIACTGYEALVADRPGTRTAYYLYHGSLWGFGLFRRDGARCR